MFKRPSSTFSIIQYGLMGLLIIFALIGFMMTAGYIAVRYGFTNTDGIIDTQTKHFIPQNGTDSQEYELFPLAHTPEWISFRQAVAKDLPIITKVSKETGVSPRLLIAILVPEQMRLFHSNRPIFKQVFEPLKILGSQSQFSWGIFGIKDETARAVENHLKDSNSHFYLGKKFEDALNFSTSSVNDQDSERFERIVNERNHYYSYKYAATYILQIQNQWEKAGFSIKNKPGIVATLWNLGFEKSKPHAYPNTGGAVLNINDKEYSFGDIAQLFYYSDEMIELFPAQ